ncbi:hypothetical protein VII00023_21302 [Vibrio ichthyoenteri ATCC 700023]|uniref:Uncharacterized protein n=1 Tax=Vibrio ichthyoenteri ATCC 700023 TaxID=870968 RepID=F9RZD6_9VIBR|nr:hypothetical protein [Vibrio ichthyoenteri]EGU45367.1 hypothetical protein VII00023_21302 [Vibrio ichthyoenteri ATCC 700023]
MLQFIKKWHQAFKEDKAVRLLERSENAHTSNKTSCLLRNEASKWLQATNEAMKQSEKEDWNGRERY